MRLRAASSLLLSAPLLLGSATADVVLHIGDATFSVDQVNARLALVPPARVDLLEQPNTSVRHYLETVLVPELLFERHASERNGPFASRDRALAFAMEARLGRQITVTSEEVAAYYEAHRAEFETPAAIELWRIVTDSEEEAQRVLDAVQGKATGAEIWSQMARDSSVDTATKMRRGDLGFVRENGHTDVPQLRVNPDLFKAAAALQDGQLVPAPVRDGERYSAVWRRGSRAERRVTLEEASFGIRTLLARERREAALGQLLGTLRARHTTTYQPDELESIDYEVPSATPKRAPRAASPSEGSPFPTATPQGDR